jgi:hypothetical protein
MLAGAGFWLVEAVLGVVFCVFGAFQPPKPRLSIFHIGFSTVVYYLLLFIRMSKTIYRAEATNTVISRERNDP